MWLVLYEEDAWADCLWLYGKDIRKMAGADALNLACRLMEAAPYDPEGKLMGSIASRAREEKFWEDIERTNYKPEGDNEVVDVDDLARIEGLDPEDFDWS